MGNADIRPSPELALPGLQAAWHEANEHEWKVQRCRLVEMIILEGQHRARVSLLTKTNDSHNGAMNDMTTARSAMSKPAYW